jgi:hypothetical protein
VLADAEYGYLVDKDDTLGSATRSYLARAEQERYGYVSFKSRGQFPAE